MADKILPTFNGLRWRIKITKNVLNRPNTLPKHLTLLKLINPVKALNPNKQNFLKTLDILTVFLRIGKTVHNFIATSLLSYWFNSC